MGSLFLTPRVAPPTVLAGLPTEVGAKPPEASAPAAFGTDSLAVCAMAGDSASRAEEANIVAMRYIVIPLVSQAFVQLTDDSHELIASRHQRLRQLIRVARLGPTRPLRLGTEQRRQPRQKFSQQGRILA